MSELSETPDELIGLLTSWALDFCPADAVHRYDEAGLEAHLRKVLLPRLIAAEAERERLREACRLEAEFPEINLANYGDDDVRRLQDWAFRFIDAARAALQAE